VGPLPPVTALAYSPDGKILAIGSYRAVLLFDIPGGRVARVLTEPIGTVQSLCWNKEGSLLAAAGGSPGEVGQVLLYDVAAGYKPISGFAGHTDVIYSVALSSDGKTMATASQDKTVRTWDIPGRKAGIVIRAHSDIVYRVRFAPNGSTLFTCGQDRAVRQFETGTGKLARSFEGHSNAVMALAVRPDGQVIVTSGVEPRLRWWNVSDGGTPRYSDGSSVQVNDIAFSSSGKLLAAAAGDHGVRVWSGENGGLMKQLMDSPDWCYAVSISPDDKFVAGAGADGGIRIWEIQPGALRATLLFSPIRDNKQPDWVMLGESGYLATSPGWQKLVTLKAGDARCTGARTQEVMAALLNPDLVQKSLRGEKVEPPVLTPPAKK
jgi:WD40 repeat protein